MNAGGTRIGSLFTGYSGLDSAVIDALGGGRTMWHSDIKPASVALLEHHHPDVPNLGDMTAIDYASVEPIDVLAASWPCQSFSSAGKRLGEADPRALWPHVARAVEATRPKVFFGENVARITSVGELRRAVTSLAALGYVGAWRVLGAADVGACHLRKRCFVLAVDAASADAQDLRDTYLPDGSYSQAFPIGAVAGSGAGGGSGRAAQGVRELGRAPGIVDVRPGGGEVHAATGQLSLLPTPTQSMTTGAGTSGRDGGMNLQTAVACPPTPSVADSRNTRNATARRSEGQGHHHSGWTLCDVAHADTWGKYGPAIARHEQALGRSAPAPTAGATKAGNPLLNPAFVEFMMMLPEGHVTGVPGLTRSQQLSLLGDGVVPAQGAAAFSFLLDHLAQRFASEAAA